MLRELSVAEQRYQAVLAVIEDDLPVTAVAEKHRVSRQTVHAWPSRYAEGGLEALADQSHRPRSCPHQMDPAVEVRLVELRGHAESNAIRRSRRSSCRTSPTTIREDCIRRALFTRR